VDLPPVTKPDGNSPLLPACKADSAGKPDAGEVAWHDRGHHTVQAEALRKVCEGELKHRMDALSSEALTGLIGTDPPVRIGLKEQAAHDRIEVECPRDPTVIEDADPPP